MSTAGAGGLAALLPRTAAPGPSLAAPSKTYGFAQEPTDLRTERIFTLTVQLFPKRGVTGGPLFSCNAVMSTGRIHAVCACLLCLFVVVHAQSFTVKAIGQSSPLADSTNTLSVTIVSDTNLSAAESSAITISGLSGAVMRSIAGGDQTSIPLKGGEDLDVFSDGNLKIKRRGAWDSSSVLTLTVTKDRILTAGTTYAFEFDTRNPPYAMASPMVNISASGSAIIAATPMTKPGTSIHGVVEGADPLTVAIPMFTIRVIGQSTPVPAALNTLSVTLDATYNLAEGSTVTIAGLTGSQTADTASLDVTTTGGRLGSSGEWSQGQGRLVLRAASGGTRAGTATVVTFRLTNPSTPQSAPTISVEAALVSQDKRIGLIHAAAMTDDGSYRRPLFVLRPEFSVLRVEQRSCLTSSSNQLDIDMQLMLDLPAHSRFTLHGLHGVQEAEGSRLPLLSTPPLAFVHEYSIFSRSAAAIETRKEVPASTPVSFSITMRNGPIEQRSPGALSVSVQVELGQNMSSIDVPPTEAEAPSQQLLWGISTCKQALVMVEPKIVSSVIYQSNPLALASNTLTVSLDLNVEMTRGSVISIIGLQDTCTPKSGFVHLQPLSSSARRELDLRSFWTRADADEYALRIQVSALCCSSTTFSIAIPLNNCNFARSYRPVLLTGFVGAVATVGNRAAYNSQFNGGEPVEMSVVEGDLLGVAGGTLPLHVVVPSMRTQFLSQSNPLAGLPNTLNMTLVSAVDLAPASLVTLHGVRGVELASSSLVVESLKPGSFVEQARYYASPEIEQVILEVGRGGLRYVGLSAPSIRSACAGPPCHPACRGSGPLPFVLAVVGDLRMQVCDRR